MIDNLKVIGRQPITTYQDNILYCMVTSSEDDGDNVRTESLTVYTPLKLGFFKMLLKHFENEYYESSRDTVLNTIKSLEQSGDLKYVRDYTQSIEIEDSDLYDCVYDTFIDMLGHQRHDDSFRSFDRVEWCYFNIAENQQIMVEV